MLNFSLNSLFVKKIVVVDIYATDDDTASINFSLFSFSLKGITLVESFHLDSISEYPFEKMAKYPVLIALSGKGVVQKQTQLNVEGEETSGLLQGINDDFYKSIYVSDAYAAVTFCRKDYLDKYINIFLEKNIPVIDVTIGTICTIRFFEKFSIQSSYIGHGYTYSDGFIENVPKPSIEVDEGIDFLGVSVKRSKFLHYILSFLFFIEGKTDLKFELPNQALISRVNFLAYKRNFPIFSLLIFFLLVLVLISTNIRDKSSSRLAQAYLNKNRIEKTISKEKAQRTQSGELIREASKISLYFDEHPFVLDKIGETVPEKITLKSISINPISSKLVHNHEISVLNGVIVVEGITLKPVNVTTWVNSLSSKEWIERVILKSFTNDGAYYQFILEILINDV